MKLTPGMQGTLAELVDPADGIDPQWMRSKSGTPAHSTPLSERAAAELSNEPQWIVWSDSAAEVVWADGELGHLFGPSH